MTGGARLEVKGFSKVTAAQLNIVSCIPQQLCESSYGRNPFLAIEL
jgi:hypothetical protein